MNLGQKTALASALFGKRGSLSAGSSQATVMTGTAQAASADGTVSVQIGEPEEGATASDLTIDVPIIGSASQGDEVTIIVQDGSPTAIAAPGWGDSVNASIENAYSELEGFSTDLATANATIEADRATAEAALNTAVDTLQASISGNAAQLSTLGRYFRVDLESSPIKVLMGEDGNPLAVQLTNEQLSFIQENSVVAFINGQRLYITTAMVNDMLFIGDFAWIRRSNGNLSLKWM